MSIINERYKGRYKGASDWIGQVMDDQCRVEGDVSIELICQLAEANGCDVSKYKGLDPKAAGRVRMTIGNMLRSRAFKRGGLYDVNGKPMTAPAEFMGDKQPVENLDGERLAKPENTDDAKAEKKDKKDKKKDKEKADA